MKYFSFVVLACSLAAPVFGALPTPIDPATARDYVNQLTVAEPKDEPKYDRKLFPHWITISGQCDTRETVLKRDGTDIVTDARCSVKSGHWVSPYDNVATTDPLDLDIDHLVPLREAWISGARDWTTDQRKQLANDLTRPQLLAVTDNLNAAKGDKDPARWMPPLEDYHCTYISAWVQVKHFYDLTIDVAEKKALIGYLDKCLGKAN